MGCANCKDKDRGDAFSSDCGRDRVVSDFYKIDRLLGQGFSSSVSLGIHKASGVPRAIKAISKTQLRKIIGFDEANILKRLDHPNIVRLIETFEDDSTVYLVVELCTGGELFERIGRDGSLTEVQAAGMMQQVLHAVSHIHLQGVCHTDLKPENILFASKAESSTLKVSDFGMAKKCARGEVLKTRSGSVHYASPEVLSGKYTQAADLWSCGVILYVLLAGYPPFFGSSDSEVLQKVRRGDFTFHEKMWSHVSQDAKNLIAGLLEMNAQRRYTVDQALSHVWVQSLAPNAPKAPLPPSLICNLQEFQNERRLRKAALQVVARELKENETKQLHNMFLSLDENGDGWLTPDEIKSGFPRSVGQDFANFLESLSAVHSNEPCGRGRLTYTEFLAASLDARQYMQEDACRAAFHVFDRNGDGVISPEELAITLKTGPQEDFSRESCELMLSEADTDGDGKLSYSEFREMLSNTSSTRALVVTL